MKFHQLPDGARFEFEGEVYTKSGALKACHERSGHLRVIRRSATVKLFEGADPAKPPSGKSQIKVKSVRAAFEVFCSVCQQCLDDAVSAGDAKVSSATRKKFDAARQEFLACLE